MQVVVRPTPSERQILIVPNHPLLDSGTLRVIACQAANYLKRTKKFDEPFTPSSFHQRLAASRPTRPI